MAREMIYVLLAIVLMFTLVISGVILGSQNFNEDVGEPVAVVFSMEKIMDEEGNLIKYESTLLGQKFFLLAEPFKDFKERFKRSYLYWKEKVI